MERRGLLRAVALGAAIDFASRGALASLSRALRLEQLVARSQHVLVAESLDAASTWEQIGERKHIVTYTRVRLLELLAGSDPKQSELMVRTLGGRVGELGELVHGEAMLSLGQHSVLFLAPSQAALAVTAMAQGHYPLAQDAAGVERLQRSPQAAELLQEDGSAVKRLAGLGLSEARGLLQALGHK